MARVYPIVEPEWLFWVKVLPVESGCWEWQAGRDERNRGRFGQGNVKAHRHSYEAFVGPIPPGLKVLHSCDNPPCVRPEHLRVGTIQDNSDDMVARGRARNQNTGKTHCKRGHAFTPDNIYWSGKKRSCRTCCIDWQKRKHSNRRAA